MPDPAPFDHSRAAAFEERLVGVLNAGALCLMTSLGHRVGLFDAMADMPAASSEAIAARSGLNERYVREWLGAHLTLDVGIHLWADCPPNGCYMPVPRQ